MGHVFTLQSSYYPFSTMKVIYDSYLRRQRNSNPSTMNNNNGINIENCQPTTLAKLSATNMNSDMLVGQPNFTHIISYESLGINKELGVGEFGVVQQGVWTNPEGRRIQVAIKCLSAARMENNRQEFLKEADIMQSISHEHIVTIYGVVLEPSVMLVTELAPLRSLLECLKEVPLISHFPVTSLCNFASQIANGMSYLESKRLIHRDLAARNILVFSKNKVKISDFGLSRALGVGKDYYQSNFNVNLKLPIAWCAPECINYLKFTSQSDVWAYGVTLWEMFSFGFQPWAALTGQQILEAIDKPNFQRLEQPECCPKEYYQLMLKCWTHEPNLRPKFFEIVNNLPDCKPELLKAIRNSSSSNNFKKDFLPYRIGDIVTVIDKSGNDSNDPAFDSFWKGVNNDRKTGYFNPNDFVAYLGQNLPSSSSTCSTTTSSTCSFVQQFLSGSNSSAGSSNGHQSNSHNSLASTITSTVLQSSKFLRGFLESKAHHNGGSSSSPRASRKARLRPEMISKPQEGKYQHLPKIHSNNSSLDGNENNKSKKLPIISHPISSYATSIKNGRDTNYSEENHEYHEISDEDDLGPLESPPFETLDFGPSLMEEVFRELDQIKPDLNNEAADSETAINENGINVKNEVRELNLKLCKEASNFRKKQSNVKPISEAEQNELDSAIAMAKDIANRTMLEDELDLAKNDSPKTPNSPNKRKFSFKFPTHKSPKGERRTFSEETESIGDIIESITPAAKEAYLSLVEKGVANNVTTSISSSLPKKDNYADKRPDVKPPPPPQAPCMQSIVPTAAVPPFNLSSPISGISNSMNDMDSNPLRMLRTAGISKVLRPKVRGNRSFSQPRLPTTAQTAGLARVASSRSQLGSPPPVPALDESTLKGQVQGHNLQGIANSLNLNALPLPPRDRSRPLIQLKTHQRRHPLVIPTELVGSAELPSNDYNLHATGDDLTYDLAKHDSPPLVHRHVPVLKQVSCPQAPAAFLNVYNKTNNGNIALANTNYNECDKIIPLPHSQLNRTYLTDDLGESLESEMQKAFENIKLNQTSDYATNEDELRNQADSNVTIMPSSQSRFTAQMAPLPSTFNTQINSNGHSATSFNGASEENNTLIKTTHKSQTTEQVIPSAAGRTVDKDEVRVMQKVLGNEANLSDEECAKLLDTTEWDIHRAIKCVRLRQQLRSHNIDVECNWSEMLTKFNWNIRQASNYLIATQGVPEDTTEV